VMISGGEKASPSPSGRSSTSRRVARRR